MKQHYVRFLLAVLLLMAGITISAHDCKVDHIYYKLNQTKKTAEVTYYGSSSGSGKYYSGSVNIPASFIYLGDTYRVTGIGDYAFSYSADLTSINIPNSVTRIGSKAFYNCTSLLSIIIPNSVTNIGSNAFDNCTSLTSVTIPNSVTEIDKHAFKDCIDLSSISIPNSVTYIGDGAFSGCIALSSFNIPDSISYIGDGAFGKTAWYNSQADGVVYAGKCVYCYKGTMPANSFINIEEGTICIAASAFSSCTDLTRISIPNSVKHIGRNAFWGCTGLPSVIIPNSVTNIDENTFFNCSGLTSVTIPNSVTSIGSFAFSGCTSLTSVTIPNSVTSIGVRAFDNCSCLTSVTINSKNIDSWFSGMISIVELTIGNETNSINSSAFKGCSSIITANIGDSVSVIGESAFEGCTSLTNLIIPSSITSIKGKAFSDCSKIENVIVRVVDYLDFCKNGVANTLRYSINKPLKLIDKDGNEIREYIVPDGLTSIDGAFCNCTSLTSVTFSNSVTNISADAFYGCTGLTSITIPNSVTSIGNYAFMSCTNLIHVTLNSNSIVSKHYTNGHGIADIFGRQVTDYVLGESITSIGDFVFQNCSSMTSISIPNSAISIGRYAFWDCTGLIQITLPDNLKTIGEGAFSGCSNLERINIPESITSIESFAFSGCKKLMEVYLPDYITNIGAGAFYYYKYSDNKIFVNRNTTTLLALWKAGYSIRDVDNTRVCEIGTMSGLPAPYFKLWSCTQTTMTIEFNTSSYEYEYYTDADCTIPLKTQIDTWGRRYISITGLRPEESKVFHLYVKLPNNDNLVYHCTLTCKTNAISPSVNVVSTMSSLEAIGTYIKGDAEVISKRIIIGNMVFEDSIGKYTGLDPARDYLVRYEINVKYGDNGQYSYTYDTKNSYNKKDLYFSTLAPKITTLQPKVISVGNVIVAAESNLDDEETNVGFEWRRTDWTDDFKSNTGGAYLYEGMMEGYIRNLNAEKLWKFRPYYESNAGNRYYGEWVGLDPSNTSYFEPTVHTYAKVSVQGNTAEVKGYAMRGSDNVVSQGFYYWANNAGARSESAQAPAVPKNAMMVEAAGNVMTAELTGLDYDTDYCYVAFVKTSENEMFYGERQSFRTGIDPTGIEEATVYKMTSTEPARYDLRGHRLDMPRKGLNIVRQADGTVRKVFVK